MQKLALWRKQFNWRMLLVRILVNGLALLITAALVPSIDFVERNVRTWLLLAITLGVLNALVKPVIQFLTLRFIFATYGVIVALINGILLFLLSLLLPDRFVVDGFIWALVGGAVLGLTSALFENLFGLTPPIVSEKYPELRRRIQEREHGSIEAVMTEATVGRALSSAEPSADMPAASPATEAAAVLAAVDASEQAPPLPADPAASSAEVSEETVAPAREPAMTAALPAEQEA